MNQEEVTKKKKKWKKLEDLDLDKEEDLVEKDE